MFVAYTTFERRFVFVVLFAFISFYCFTAFNNEDSKFLGNNFSIRSNIHKVALLLRLKLSTLGIFFVLPCIEKYTKVDLRTSVIDIPPQEVCSDVSKAESKMGFRKQTVRSCQAYQ